jgi:DNA invertase Pin-like site-specific DNA recombinase
MNRMTGVYLRVSTGDQRLDSQEHELKRYCHQRGWKVVSLYKDKISGTKTSRPGLDDLVRDMRLGRLDRVVCYKLDRLGRSLTHLAMILDEMNRLRVPLICTSQGIDTSDDNPAGKLQLGVLMAVAEFERGIIRERVNAGLAAARKRGVRFGRPNILNRRRHEITVLRKAGKGIREIARQLKMPVSSVHSILN